MNTFFDSLGTLVVQYPAWSHWLIALGMALQGEITIFVSMYLIANRSLGWTDFLIPAFASVIIVDYFLYLLGRALRTTRFGWKFYKKIKAKRRTQWYLYYVRENLNKLILISKFLLGGNIIILTAVGWAKTKFGRFARAHFLSVSLWLGCMIAIMYSMASGLFYLKSTASLKQVEIGIGIFVLIIFLGEYILKRALGKRVGFEAISKDLKDEDEEEEESREN